MENKHGKLLKARREEIGYSQGALAEKIGCSQPNIVKIERGSLPDIVMALKLGKWLKIKVDDLYLHQKISPLEKSNQIISGVEQKQEQHPLIKQVIDLMEATDDQGKEAILVAARSAGHVRMVQLAELKKINRETDEIQKVFDTSDGTDLLSSSQLTAPARKVPKA